MTDISGGFAGAHWSPFNRLQSQLQSAVANGSVKSADQDALTAAIADIASQLGAGKLANGSGTAAGAATSGPKATGSFKDRVESLIAGEVTSGKLTQAQATELKDLFAAATSGAHHANGIGHHHHGKDDGKDLLSGFVDTLKSALGAAATYGARANPVAGAAASLFVNALA